MTNTASSGPEVTNVVASTGANHYVFEFIAVTNEIRQIDAGQVVQMHCYMWRDGNPSAEVTGHWELYERENGTETNEIETGETVTLERLNPDSSHDRGITMTRTLSLQLGSSLVAKWKIDSIVGPTLPNIYLKTEGSTAARISLNLGTRNFQPAEGPAGGLTGLNGEAVTNKLNAWGSRNPWPTNMPPCDLYESAVFRRASTLTGVKAQMEGGEVYFDAFVKTSYTDVARSWVVAYTGALAQQVATNIDIPDFTIPAGGTFGVIITNMAASSTGFWFSLEYSEP
jgi:hypothetical protein